jgi:hypothetical protein
MRRGIRAASSVSKRLQPAAHSTIQDQVQGQRSKDSYTSWPAAGPYRLQPHTMAVRTFFGPSPQGVPTMKSILSLSSAIALAFATSGWAQQPQPIGGKPATAATKAANEAVLKDLPFADKSDFDDAQRGFIARPDTLTIKNAQGNVVWDLEVYKSYIGLTTRPPRTRSTRVCGATPSSTCIYGLYKVAGPHLPGARLRPVEHQLHRGQDGLDRLRPAHLHRDRQGGLRPT